MLRRNGQLFGLALGIAAFVVIGLALSSPDAPAQPPYASSSAGPAGVKGLYALLKEQDVPVKAWKQSWKSLPQTGGQALIVVEPHDVGAAEMAAIKEWAAAGNDVLLLEDDPWQWEEHFPLKAAEAGTEPEAIEAAEAESGGPLTGIVASAYRLESGGSLEPLLTDRQGIVAGRVSSGGGSVTVLLAPEWARNDRILDHSHFELIWPLLPLEADAVWFDDYHHGLRQAPGMLAAYPDWLLAVLLQLAVGAALWLWLQAVRFGPAYTPRSWTVRRGDETLLAAAGWYERRKLTREAAAHQEAYIRSLLRQRWGVPPQASEQQVLAAAKRRWNGADAERLAGLLGQLREAGSLPEYPVKRFVKDSRQADGIIRKLEKE